VDGVRHGAKYRVVGLYGNLSTIMTENPHGADHMSVIMRRVEIGRSMGDHAIFQHVAAVTIYQGNRQVLVSILTWNDFVQTVFGEQFRPLLKTVIINAIDVIGNNL
jgi:hypothetical protein